LLDYLEALTFDFERDGQTVSCVLIYAEPDPDQPRVYHSAAAAEHGDEGIACVDDPARAALLALGVYERTRSRKALALARRWLTFVAYMQYADGSFANFIRNAAGVRNATGPTSPRGRYWWSVRAKWALARAYRLTGDREYRDRYDACVLESIPDGKIRAVEVLAALEVYRHRPQVELRSRIIENCDVIASLGDEPYFQDHPETPVVHLWGYHQLHAVAAAAELLEADSLLTFCRQSVSSLVEPDVRALFWYSYPDRRTAGVCAYTVTPIVQGLAAFSFTHLTLPPNTMG